MIGRGPSGQKDGARGQIGEARGQTEGARGQTGNDHLPLGLGHGLSSAGRASQGPARSALPEDAHA